MTEEDFRKDPAFRIRWGELMEEMVTKTALSVVKSKNETVCLPPGLSGIDHASALSERQTRCRVVQELLDMTQTWPDGPEAARPMTFGTQHTVDEFDQPHEAT